MHKDLLENANAKEHTHENMKLKSYWIKKSHLKMNYLSCTKPLPFLFSPLWCLWCSLMSRPLQRWFVMRWLDLSAYKGTKYKTNQESYCCCLWLLQPQLVHNQLLSVHKCSWCCLWAPQKGNLLRQCLLCSHYAPGTGLYVEDVTELASHSGEAASK